MIKKSKQKHSIKKSSSTTNLRSGATKIIEIDEPPVGRNLRSGVPSVVLRTASQDDKQSLIMVANNIILNFDKLKENSEHLQQIIHYNKLKFSFGRRDKTKYGDRALRSLFTLRNLCRAVVIGLSNHYYCTQDVYKLISQTYQTYGSLDEIANMTSVGYLIDGYSSTHPVNVTINLIAFGLTTISEWQYHHTTRGFDVSRSNK